MHEFLIATAIGFFLTVGWRAALWVIAGAVLALAVAAANSLSFGQSIFAALTFLTGFNLGMMLGITLKLLNLALGAASHQHSRHLITQRSWTKVDCEIGF